jgi:hypothetical protein
MPQPRFTPENGPVVTHSIGGLEVLRAGLDPEARGKILCLCLQILIKYIRGKNTTLMMEAAHTSETSGDIQLRTQQYIPKDYELHTCRRDILKSHKFCITSYLCTYYLLTRHGKKESVRIPVITYQTECH